MSGLTREEREALYRSAFIDGLCEGSELVAAGDKNGVLLLRVLAGLDAASTVDADLARHCRFLIGVAQSQCQREGLEPLIGGPAAYIHHLET